MHITYQKMILTGFCSNLQDWCTNYSLCRLSCATKSDKVYKDPLQNESNKLMSDHETQKSHLHFFNLDLHDQIVSNWFCITKSMEFKFSIRHCSMLAVQKTATPQSNIIGHLRRIVFCFIWFSFLHLNFQYYIADLSYRPLTFLLRKKVKHFWLILQITGSNFIETISKLFVVMNIQGKWNKCWT